METLTVTCVCLSGLNIIIQGFIYIFNFVFKTEINNHIISRRITLSYRCEDLNSHYKSQRQQGAYTRHTSGSKARLSIRVTDYQMWWEQNTIGIKTESISKDADVANCQWITINSKRNSKSIEGRRSLRNCVALSTWNKLLTFTDKYFIINVQGYMNCVHISCTKVVPSLSSHLEYICLEDANR